MALNLSKIDHLSQDRQDTVRGFIRKCQGYIPDEIVNICILFYAFPHEFDEQFINRERLVFDKNTQTMSKKVVVYSPSSVYLKDIVESGRHKWKFKIVQRSGCLLIGIWKVQKHVSPPMNTYFTEGTDKGYAYSLSAGKTTSLEDGCSTYKYAKICKSGDIVEMILDFDESSLSFIVNGKDYGKAYDHIQEEKYRAAVFLGGPCTIQIAE